MTAFLVTSMKLTQQLALVTLIHLSVPVQAKTIYVQLSDSITLKMTDGDEYVVRAASHLMTSRTKTHLIVNDETVDTKTRPQNSRFSLGHEDKGMKLMVRCELIRSTLTGNVHDALFDPNSMKRNLNKTEQSALSPMACAVLVDGKKIGQLTLDKLVKLETKS